MSTLKPDDGYKKLSKPRDGRVLNSARPQTTTELELHWAYGYRGAQCRNNVHTTRDGRLVYFVAGVAVLHEVRTGAQRFYTQHTDDITCLTTLPGTSAVGGVAATGQCGDNPFVCVWSTAPATVTHQPIQTLAIIKLNQRGSVGQEDKNTLGGSAETIVAITFASDAQTLILVSTDDKKRTSTVSAWRWRTGRLVAKVQLNDTTVFCGWPHPHWANAIVTGGIDHVHFWRLTGNTLIPLPAKISRNESTKRLSESHNTVGDSQKLPTILCAAFASRGVTFTGALDGSIYVWQKDKNIGIVPTGHKNGVYCLVSTHFGSDGGYITGGQDSVVRFWDKSFRSVNEIDLAPLVPYVEDWWVRALTVCSETQLYIGTQQSYIIEVLPPTATGAVKASAHVIVEGHCDGELWGLAAHPQLPVCATGGDDCWLRNLNLITALTKHSLPVHEIEFSPKTSHAPMLAIGCNDGTVDVYKVDGQSFIMIGTCGPGPKHVAQVDWSVNGHILQINYGDASVVPFAIPDCTQIESSECLGQADEWASYTCVDAPLVGGVWPPCAKQDDVNAVCLWRSPTVLCTGDDYGLVKLFTQFPLSKGAKAQPSVYTGHSAHVTNVRFCLYHKEDQLFLLSTGGADRALFQWKVVSRRDLGHFNSRYFTHA